MGKTKPVWLVALESAAEELDLPLEYYTDKGCGDIDCEICGSHDFPSNQT